MISPSSKRQQQRIDVGKCHHVRRAPVHNCAGEQIAIRCEVCTKILAHIGTCDGCRKPHAELFCLVTHARKRFCDLGCWEKWKAAKRQATRAASLGK